jgi:hypothetical protein
LLQRLFNAFSTTSTIDFSADSTIPANGQQNQSVRTRA